jgi:hypothetical protein
MAKARIKREKNWKDGVVTFTDLGTEKTLACNCDTLFPMYNMSVAEAIEHLQLIEDGETPVYGEVPKRGICHFLNAKVGDSASDPDDDAIDQMVATNTALEEGRWSLKGDGTGAGGRISDVITALFNLAIENGEDVTEVMVADWFNGLPDEGAADVGQGSKKSWKAKAHVQVEVQNIRDARTKARKTKLKAQAKSEGTFSLGLPAAETSDDDSEEGTEEGE